MRITTTTTINNMIYLIVIASIYLTLLTIQTLYNASLVIRQQYKEYSANQRLLKTLHPEVTLADIENDDDIMTLVFDRAVTERIMNNENSSDTLLLTDILNELDDD
jgi:hypothetical protein